MLPLASFFTKWAHPSQVLPDNETEKEVFLGVFFQPRSLQWQEAGVEFVTSSQGHHVTILDHFAHVGRHSQPDFTKETFTIQIACWRIS